ncbi:pyridoxamine 5'-phosphate oxidase family protein [Nonomuraea endophytica]|uniref:Putative pyridoxine 5'-phosphate oxidase superfamily flavin-nucleotide-binding protein n=1 Tax=Nonomuraea endophytica TaxID=714136 RepID=A0A7W8AAS8_9ACTN|nr:putative pyridoxine 5'-phosphate oxidase superfamily flavin-nucleotide-binding protein [Nonomuraea endophytica]
MATSDATGLPDCSPRGDYPGFGKVLDERTLAIPDRPGNKLADSFRNLAENDGIGLMFVIPGLREVLRVNGRAYPTDEPDVAAVVTPAVSRARLLTLMRTPRSQRREAAENRDRAMTTRV